MEDLIKDLKFNLEALNHIFLLSQSSETLKKFLKDPAIFERMSYFSNGTNCHSSQCHTERENSRSGTAHVKCSQRSEFSIAFSRTPEKSQDQGMEHDSFYIRVRPRHFTFPVDRQLEKSIKNDVKIQVGQYGQRESSDSRDPMNGFSENSESSSTSGDQNKLSDENVFESEVF